MEMLCSAENASRGVYPSLSDEDAQGVPSERRLSDAKLGRQIKEGIFQGKGDLSRQTSKWRLGSTPRIKVK